MKFCRDCHYFRQFEGGWNHGCVAKPDPVTGEVSSNYYGNADLQRRLSGFWVCGKKGRWFKPKVGVTTITATPHSRSNQVY